MFALRKNFSSVTEYPNAEVFGIKIKNQIWTYKSFNENDNYCVKNSKTSSNLKVPRINYSQNVLEIRAGFIVFMDHSFVRLII